MPLKRKPKQQTLADGVADFYRKRPGRSTAFGAALNPTSADDMDFICRLHFGLEAKRERDIEFADRSGFTLSMKIRTWRVPGIDSDCMAIVGGRLYDVAHIDDAGQLMYVFLDGGEPVGDDSGADRGEA